MRLKKIISTFIVLSMVLQMFYVFPASAEVGNNLYKYEDYSVEYNVTNEWDGGQTVEIKIINTGTESILNWAVKYDIDGEISNLWNAQVYDSKDNTYIFKNCGWNYEIRPNEYVTFGYTIKNHTFSMPEKFISCSERETLTLGYSVDLNIISEWDTGAQGEIVVTNTSTEPLEAWVLSFDSTFSIDNLWNARVLSNENNHYSFASESWTNPIEVGESKVIGFVASKTTEAQLEIANYSLSVIKINNNLNESDSSEDDKILDKLIISAYGGYVVETDSIDIVWMSTISDGTFEVLVSEDNIEYTVIKTVTDTDGCSIKANLIQKYIKIKQTANDQTAESQPLVVTKTGNGYIIDYTDTDNDGLYDYIEEAVGSDKLLSDTDNDGLSDYEEVYLTNTDPAVYNSVESDLSDAEADSDNDGLSNYDEIVLGTMSLNDDSDEDGLIDGDEINQHDTDPLKYDTDNDGICDGDEIILGLDPNNAKTNGVLDCEYTTIQILDSNNNIFGDINTEENSYSISLELCISGLADTNLEVRKSGYSEIVQNDAILGSVLELDYPDDLLVDDVKINFEIKDEYIKNSKSISYDEFKGIKRLNVFRYFEEMNMLLPIESFHDTKTNTVYAETDMLGTYCLIDMEAWLDNIGITSEYSSYITTATLSENIVDDNSEYTATEYQAKSENITSYENTYSTNVQEETFVIVLEPVVEFSDEIRDEYFHNAVYKCASDIDKEYEKYKIYILDSKGNILTSPYGLSYATSLYDVHCICTNYSYSDICGDSVQSTRYFYALINSGVVFDKTDFAKLLSGMYLQDRNLAEFLLLPSTQFKENMTFSNESQHFHIKFAFGLQNKIGYAVKIPHILTATGLTVLPEYFGRVSPDNNLDYDNDGLANNVEIDWNNPLISNGKLPTLETCICTANSSGKLTYVQNGLERLRNLPYNEYYGLLKSEILPLTSDPLSEDSDEDGANDIIDIYPLEYDETPNEFRKMYFSNLISEDKIYHTDDGFYICMVSVETILEKMNCDLKDKEDYFEREYFDDWYLYAVKKDYDYVYSMVKMREIGDCNPKKNYNPCGIAVPFSRLDMSIFNEYAYVDVNGIEHLNNLATGDISLCNGIIANYFSNTASKGSYLIGNLYYEKIIDESFNDTNTVNLENEVNFLEAAFNVMLIQGITYFFRDYASRPDSITIKDKSNITQEERYQIMRYSLGSSSLNSFAAEVQAHAIFALGGELCSNLLIEIETFLLEDVSVSVFIKEKSVVPYLISTLVNDMILSHSISADVSYGEEALSCITFAIYLEEWSLMTRWQIEEHGNLIYGEL